MMPAIRLREIFKIADALLAKMTPREVATAFQTCEKAADSKRSNRSLLGGDEFDERW